MPSHLGEDYIYLDYAATAPLCEEAAVAMQPYQVFGRAHLGAGGNANSLHSVGRSAFEQMERCRRELAKCVGARRPDEIMFTSGATEADNAAVLGLADAQFNRRKRSGSGNFTPHVIVSAIEHDAVLAPAKRLESLGYRVTRLSPNRQGFIELDALEGALDADTVLVSIMMANSEIGSVQPIAEMAKLAHANGALFHTDAVQALGKISVNVSDLDVDAASFSAHKVGGPKGVGALYLRARTPFTPFMLGGGQETGRRSGTQNLCGIVGFTAACAAAVNMQAAEWERLSALRDRLYERLPQIKEVRATVDVEKGSASYLPNIVHMLVEGFESETLILRLDTMGIGVSGGSACSSHSLEASHVLRAMAIDSDRAHGALRISMGRYTTESDIEALLDALPACLSK